MTKRLQGGLTLWLLSMIILLGGCRKQEEQFALDIPTWFPEMPVPEDNALTDARVSLGRKLFYEPLLSVDSSVSCATCHIQQLAFTDGKPISIGVNASVGLRNAPTLANVGYAPRLFMDGGVETLELQAQAPIFTTHEMNFTIAGFLNRIKDDGTYVRLFEKAYARTPDAFGISRAIAAFERTLVSAHSRYDQFAYEGKTDALSQSEKRGYQLFFSERTQCVSCHAPPLFTNYAYENIGLYTHYADSGRARISHLPEDNGKFKVPTLRNIELTAPYMHDGSMATLQEVVEHFNNGGVGHPNQDQRIRPLGLSEQERSDLVAFLRTLTDHAFLTELNHAAPN